MPSIRDEYVRQRAEEDRARARRVLFSWFNVASLVFVAIVTAIIAYLSNN